ncbi:hypothetical protein TNCV_4747471 [Trichonephila clavipes]|nr:hypothetical protein TNCV_4747471 [Trichonephila clavipes]
MFLSLPLLTTRIASHRLAILSSRLSPTVLEVRMSIPQSATGPYVGCNHVTRRLPQTSPTCSMVFNLGENASHSIRVIFSLSSSC